MLIYLLIAPMILIRDVQGIENDVLNVNHNNDLVDLLFPIIDTANPASIHVILVLFLWCVIGFSIEFTHRYHRWHRIVDVSTIIIIVVICWILYQQYSTGQFSENTILQMLPYILTLFLGAFIGYVINRVTTKHESEN